MIVELRVNHWVKFWALLGLSGWFNHYIIALIILWLLYLKNSLNPLYNFNIIKVVFISASILFYVLIE